MEMDETSQHREDRIDSLTSSDNGNEQVTSGSATSPSSQSPLLVVEGGSAASASATPDQAEEATRPPSSLNLFNGANESARCSGCETHFQCWTELARHDCGHRSSVQRGDFLRIDARQLQRCLPPCGSYFLRASSLGQHQTLCGHWREHRRRLDFQDNPVTDNEMVET
jgi:hypothetical protein